jgi:hypothetical protein
MSNCKGRIQIKGVCEQAAEVNIRDLGAERSNIRSTTVYDVVPHKARIYKYN